MSIDFSALFRPQGPTRYPVHPLAQLLQNILLAKEFRKQQTEQTEEQAYRRQVREAQARERELQPLRERANFYLTQYQQDPRGAFKAAYEDNPEFRELTQRLYGFQAPTVTTGIPGGPEIAPAPGQDVAGTALSGIQQTFKLPGPPPPAFQTVGEMAAKFGYRLRSGVDASLRIDQLPRNVNVNALFVDPAVDREKEQKAAKARLEQVTQLYSVPQIFKTPELREPFLRDYQTVYGQPFPTRATPETIERRTPQTFTSTPAITGTGPGLARAGLPQTVSTGPDIVQQVPTGRDLTVPILPEPSTKRVVFVNNEGRVVQSLELPEGTDVKTVTAPTPQHPARFVITDSRGNVVREFEAPPGTQLRVLPAPPRDTGGAGRAAPGGLVGLLTLRSQGHQTGNPHIDRLTPQQADQISRDPRLNRLDLLELLLGGQGAPAPAAPAPPAHDGTTPRPAPARGGAPTRDAQDVLAIYTRTKKPVTKALWQKLTPDEQAWLRRQGVKVEP